MRIVVINLILDVLVELLALLVFFLELLVKLLYFLEGGEVTCLLWLEYFFFGFSWKMLGFAILDVLSKVPGCTDLLGLFFGLLK